MTQNWENFSIFYLNSIEKEPATSGNAELRKTKKQVWTFGQSIMKHFLDKKPPEILQKIILNKYSKTSSIRTPGGSPSKFDLAKFNFYIYIFFLSKIGRKIRGKRLKYFKKFDKSEKNTKNRRKSLRIKKNVSPSTWFEPATSRTRYRLKISI